VNPNQTQATSFPGQYKYAQKLLLADSKAGVNDCIVKPFNQEQLGSVLMRNL